MVESRFPLGARALPTRIKGNHNNGFPYRARALSGASKGNMHEVIIEWNTYTKLL